MKGETKGVLSIFFSIFAFSNPVSSILLFLYPFVLQQAFSNVPRATTLIIYFVLTIISSVIFLILAFYFAYKTRKEKYIRLSRAGFILAVLALIYVVWFTVKLIQVGASKF